MHRPDRYPPPPRAGRPGLRRRHRACPSLAQAQAFPARPIRLICPWPAGGSTDAVMRALAESAGKALGGQMIVENKAGASGMLGPNELVNGQARRLHAVAAAPSAWSACRTCRRCSSTRSRTSPTSPA